MGVVTLTGCRRSVLRCDRDRFIPPVSPDSTRPASLGYRDNARMDGRAAVLARLGDDRLDFGWTSRRPWLGAFHGPPVFPLVPNRFGEGGDAQDLHRARGFEQKTLLEACAQAMLALRDVDVSRTRLDLKMLTLYPKTLVALQEMYGERVSSSLHSGFLAVM